MKKTTIAGLVCITFSIPALSAENIALDDVTVKANRFERKDTETTYASEIYTSKKIETSGAATLYDFLAQQTSLNVLSNFGNKATPSINLRGFGAENGTQNVVITLDGQRLNNIDGQPQLLSAIPLSNIDRIEISKGSGSVIYGDGATAGAIQIYTKNKTGVTVSTSFGNYGQQNHFINAGISEQYFDLSANVAQDSHDGFSKQDITGHKDTFSSKTENLKLKIKPTETLRFLLEGTSSRNDFRYVNPLTQTQFKDDPRQDPRNPDFFGNVSPYNHQTLDSDQWRVGSEYDINSQLKIKATHFREDKRSAYITYASEYRYDYDSNELELTYTGDTFNIAGGLQTFYGDRKASDNVTSKNNKAVFVQTEYRPTWLSEALTVSAGARNEEVKYRYAPISGSTLNASENLNAWDIGANYRFGNSLSVFANFNQAFQAPDIDRFFASDYSAFPVISTSFNGFIAPAKSRTLNIGLNHTLANNHFKITAFRANLHDEIYLVPFVFKNTNIDKSHKYGLEVQDTFKFNNQLTTSLVYNYTRAIIDKETDDAGTYDGNDLPGVPKHTIVANLNYKFLDHANLNLNHTWRSKAYAYNDFQNNFSQRQGHYESTNISLSYQLKNMQVFTSINNLFEHANSIQVADDAIYPVDFVRTWRVGVKADF
jgi:iron complex outermembrane receptor protein